MALESAQMQPGPDGILGTADDVQQYTNQITPFVDQSQTYASDSSHQAFLREDMIGADGKLHSTGRLLSDVPEVDATGVTRTTLATFADLKASAANFLGIKITDTDVNSVPLLATDAYGNLILGANGQDQLVVTWTSGPLKGTQGLVEGNLAAPVATSGTLNGVGYKALTTGGGFIDDKAPTADPVDPATGAWLLPDADTVVNAANSPPAAGRYDNELLDMHKVAGDGRLNENLGLTAIQQIFHAEHDRLIAKTKEMVQSELNNGDISFASDWVLPGVVLTPGVAIADNQWNGERLFQVAKFGTETEYMHIVFEEFARMIAPNIHVAGGVNVHIDPAITSEFANVVYRFGHSMLDENLNVYQLGADGRAVMAPVYKLDAAGNWLDANGQVTTVAANAVVVSQRPVMTPEGLIDAFTNPMKFASDPNMTADLVMGMTNQVGNEIDEFVTGTLENNLDGAPLDLAAINIARGRDTGVAPLNLVRNQLFAQSGEIQLKAYTSWVDFGGMLKHPESLVNFIASYGTHASITGATSNAAKQAAAALLVHEGTFGDPLFNPGSQATQDAYNFLNSKGVYANK